MPPTITPSAAWGRELDQSVSNELGSPPLPGAAGSAPVSPAPRPEDRRARTRRIVRRGGYIAGAGLPFLVLLIYLVDLPLAEACRGLDGEPIDRFLNRVEVLGEGRWYIAPGFAAAIVMYFIRAGSWRAPLCVALSVAISGILINILKIGFGRYRPARFFDSGQYGFAFFELEAASRSFPSGHATTAFAAATVLSVLLPAYRVAWFSLAGLIAVARVVTGAHYLSDVFAGAWFGTMTALILAVYLLPGPSETSRTGS